MLIRHFHSVHEQYPVLAFLDIKSAYDTADRSIIWGFLRQSVSTSTLAIIMHMFKDVRVCIINSHYSSRYIRPRRGVLQGSILSPLLYAIFINSLPQRLRYARHLSRPLTLCTTPVRA